ncbi:unnamed protein product [Nezara viridula]|uniref:Uncharacterized protein n=1 Tax=Nezara viridula TaxID=85310 RepID=A0A9P0MJB3_NEZVI|nr:unnamed protein product [Nezara viridula]
MTFYVLLTVFLHKTGRVNFERAFKKPFSIIRFEKTVKQRSGQRRLPKPTPQYT